MPISSISRSLLAFVTFPILCVPVACRAQFDPGAAVGGTKISAGRNSTSRAASGSHSPAATAPRAAASSSAGPGAPTVRHELMDQAWGLPWGAITLPPGWGFNGGVIHAGYQGCSAAGDTPMWVGESPDKLTGVAVLPTLKTNWTTDRNMDATMQRGGCPMLRSVSAKDYITQYVLPHIQGKSARVVDVGPEPQLKPLVDQLQGMNAQLEQTAVRSQFMQSRRTVDSARIYLTYEEGGRQVNEIASTVFACTDTMMAMPGMQGLETLDCVAPITMILHVPDDGKPFNRASLEAQTDASKPGFFKIDQNPAWNQRLQQEQQRQNQAMQAQFQAQQQANQQRSSSNADAFAQQQAIRQGVSDYRRQVTNNVYQNRQAANSQVTGAYAAHMGDYNVYTNPNTGQQVQLSNQYNNTYVNQNGTVGMQTNSAGSPGPNWTLMVPKY